MPMHFLWLDLETTGLRPENDLILEIGAVLTGEDLEPVNTFHRILPWSRDQLNQVPILSVVQEMHTKNGLFAEINLQRQALDHAYLMPDQDQHPVMAEAFREWILMNVPEAARKETYLSGSSVHFDARFMHSLGRGGLDLISHRILDVSALKIFYQHALWIVSPKHESRHRSLPDIHDSIAEYKRYLSMAKNPPGRFAES